MMYHMIAPTFLFDEKTHNSHGMTGHVICYLVWVVEVELGEVLLGLLLHQGVHLEELSVGNTAVFVIYGYDVMWMDGTLFSLVFMFIL